MKINDKVKHLIAGAGVASLVLIISLLHKRVLETGLAITFAFLAGSAKEIYDVRFKHSEFSILDIVATVLGGILAVIFFSLYYE